MSGTRIFVGVGPWADIFLVGRSGSREGFIFISFGPEKVMIFGLIGSL